MMLSMCKKINLNRIFIFAFLSGLMFSGCTKLENTSLGGDLIPGSDKLYTDTMLLPVETYSFVDFDTSIVGKSDQHVIGFINDPLMGTTTAMAFFQMQPSIYPFQFPVGKDSLFLDSVVLSLTYGGIYGDTNAVSGVRVYRLNDTSFKPAKRYTVNEGLNFSEFGFLGSKTFTGVSLRNGYKLAYKDDSVYNELRIRLNNLFGRQLLELSNEPTLLTDSAFKVFLNGFAVVPDSTGGVGGALHYFTLNSTNSRINLYYRALNDSGRIDTSLAVFPYNVTYSFSANANKIHRSYNGSTAQPYLNSSTPGQFAYLLTAPGTAVRVKVPGLDTLTGKKYIIHRAELVAREVHQGPLAPPSLYYPPTIHMYTINSEGKNATIPYDSTNYFGQYAYDYIRNVMLYSVSTTYTGGIPTYFQDASNNTVAEYRMNMTRYIQNVVNGKTASKDLKLAAPYYAAYAGGQSSASAFNAIAFGRVQLGGGSHPQYPMYVRIYYSKE